MAKFRKSDIKTLIKECLLEILAEEFIYETTVKAIQGISKQVVTNVTKQVNEQIQPLLQENKKLKEQFKQIQEEEYIETVEEEDDDEIELDSDTSDNSNYASSMTVEAAIMAGTLSESEIQKYLQSQKKSAETTTEKLKDIEEDDTELAKPVTAKADIGPDKTNKTKAPRTTKATKPTKSVTEMILSAKETLMEQQKAPNGTASGPQVEFSASDEEKKEIANRYKEMLKNADQASREKKKSGITPGSELM